MKTCGVSVGTGAAVSVHSVDKTSQYARSCLRLPFLRSGASLPQPLQPSTFKSLSSQPWWLVLPGDAPCHLEKAPAMPLPSPQLFMPAHLQQPRLWHS